MARTPGVCAVIALGLAGPAHVPAPAGVVTEYSAGITAGAVPDVIVAGPDGNLWFTEIGADRVGRITPGGAVTEFSEGITRLSGVDGITVGPGRAACPSCSGSTADQISGRTALPAG